MRKSVNCKFLKFENNLKINRYTIGVEKTADFCNKQKLKNRS